MTVPSFATAPELSRDDLQKLQRARKRLLLGLFGLTLVAIFFTDSYWYTRRSALYGAIEWFGIVLIFACILGRTWCSLYIGGRKKRELVTVGPYSLVRNPLYIFTLLGAVGIGAQSGSLLIAGWFAAVTFIVFDRVVRSEERFLAEEFPSEFQAYARRVHRFLPRFAGWSDVDELFVRPRLIRQTFLDAGLLLVSIPAADMLETLQRYEITPVLLRLP
jgi:protein-S-isoprenylcysteine O-methyltransferase Ste14